MGDSLITVVAIFLAAILMFVFPLMSVSQNNDNVAQLAVQTLTNDFVANIRSSGKLTMDDYDSFMQQLDATGNRYEIEIERKVLDENIGRKSAYLQGDSIGENRYYSEYTSSILEFLESEENKQTFYPYILYEGDIIKVDVKNTNTTLAQIFSNFFYTITGNNEGTIAATASGMVTTNGGNKVVD